eukprot:PITA_34821
MSLGSRAVSWRSRKQSVPTDSTTDVEYMEAAEATKEIAWLRKILKDLQTERVNRILEDMLRMYVMHHQRIWEVYLPLVEFSYNNGYQESLRMSPFEALYGQSCNTPISLSDLVNRVFIGLDMLVDMEREMKVIKKNLKVTQDRKESYAH